MKFNREKRTYPVVHWNGIGYRGGAALVYCGTKKTKAMAATDDKTKVNCLRCKAAMRLHGHLGDGVLMSKSEKYTLITNLKYVVQKDTNLRFHCKALVLSEVPTGVCAGYSMRGFGVVASQETFDMRLDPEKHFPSRLFTRQAPGLARAIATHVARAMIQPTGLATMPTSYLMS